MIIYRTEYAEFNEVQVRGLAEPLWDIAEVLELQGKVHHAKSCREAAQLLSALVRGKLHIGEITTNRVSEKSC